MIESKIESIIEDGTPEQVQNIAQNAPKPIANEAKQTLDNNPKNDEVNNEKIKEGLKSPGSSFLSEQDFLDFVDSDTPKGSNIPVDSSEEESFEDFVKQQEQKEVSKVNNTESLADISPRESLENIAEVVNRARNEILDEETVENIYNQAIEALESAGYFDKLKESTDEHKREMFRDDFDALYKALMHKAKWSTNKSNLEKAIETKPKEVNDSKIGKFLNSGVNWDKVKVYEPGEDPYSRVSDESDWKNNPDYEPTDEPVMSQIHKDEDFLGPDEYIDENGNIQVDPNWKPENADEDFAGPDELPATIYQIKDEDFVGPDEQLAVINDGLPAEIPYEPVYDTSDYNFDWEAVVETLPPDVQQELNELPEEDKEEISNLLHWRTKKLGDIKAGGSVASSDAIDMGSSRGGIGGSTRNPVGNSMLGMSLRATNANVGQGIHESTKMDSNASIASKAPIPPTVNETTGAKVGGSNNNTPRSNGSIGSGSGLLFNKVGMLKSEKSAPEIPMLGHTSNVDELNAPTIEDTIDDMKEGLIETLEAKLNANPEVAEQLGFDHKYKHWVFNGITLEEMSVAQLNELISELTD